MLRREGCVSLHKFNEKKEKGGVRILYHRFFSILRGQRILSMEALLDFSVPLDVGLLDKVVQCMNYGQEPQRSQADRVLTMFRENSDAWQHTYTIIEGECCLEAKFFALQILENLIRFRWRSLGIEQRDKLKTYLGQKIVTVRPFALFFSSSFSIRPFLTPSLTAPPRSNKLSSKKDGF